MAEKPVSFEVHPMRGHSRGEWYGTRKDIVNPEQGADYWAIFSVTPRGNKHCVGEFPTKAEALAALRYAEKKG